MVDVISQIIGAAIRIHSDAFSAKPLPPIKQILRILVEFPLEVFYYGGINLIVLEVGSSVGVVGNSQLLCVLHILFLGKSHVLVEEEEASGNQDGVEDVEERAIKCLIIRQARKARSHIHPKIRSDVQD